MKGRKRKAPDRLEPEDFVAAKLARASKQSSQEPPPDAQPLTGRAAKPSAKRQKRVGETRRHHAATPAPRAASAAAAGSAKCKRKKPTAVAPSGPALVVEGGAPEFVEETKRLMVAFKATGPHGMPLLSAVVLPHSSHAGQ
jgi:hypothetical protein